MDQRKLRRGRSHPDSGWMGSSRTGGQVRESFEHHLEAIHWGCHLAKAEGEELVIHAVSWSDRGGPLATREGPESWRHARWADRMSLRGARRRGPPYICIQAGPATLGERGAALTKEGFMRRALVFVAALAVGGATPGSSTALSPTISSHQIGPRERPVISFTADRRTGGNFSCYEDRHLELPAREAVVRRAESLSGVLSSFPPGVGGGEAEALDMGKWCTGRWRGRIFLDHRVGCGATLSDDPDSICTSGTLVAGVFWFRVAG